MGAWLHMGDTKETLRARVSCLRDSLSKPEIVHKSRLIHDSALGFLPYLECRAVALYSAIGSEVQTDDIQDHARNTGKKIFYPKLGAGMNLHLVRVENRENLKPGRYGILEPPGDGIWMREDEEGLVVFVPGLAFDLHGNRLGRGQGWYDRLLAALDESVRFIGLAYELQISGEVPTDPWDRKVHHIITERRVIDCRDLPSHSRWVS
jgi:5-formyltetrahydrofolate cyclo-ligase